MKLALIGALALALPSARPLPPGGSLGVVLFRSAPASSTLRFHRSAELFVAAQVLEPILSMDEGPALATLIAESPSRLVLELQPGGYSGERPVELADLEQRLYALARPTSPGAHTVLPVAGARARIAGETSAALGVEVRDHQLHIELEAPYPHAALLLAALATAAPTTSGPAGFLFTGAFRPAAWPAARLVPEPRHRQGRPFAAEVEFLRVQTQFGLRSELRRRTGLVTFGLPAPSGADAARTQRVGPLGHPASELVFLRAGHQSDLPIDILHAVGAALPRDRLAEREWAGETTPAPSVRLGAECVLARDRRLAAPRTATLSYLEEEGPGRRMIERLQLDLLRLGVSARLDPLDLARFTEKQRSRSFDLLVEPITLEGSIAPLEVHELHRLLALAAHYGVLPRVLAAADLARFASSPPHLRAEQLEATERELLRAARIVPLVRRELETRVSRELEGLRMRSFGVPDLGSTLASPPERNP